MRIKIKFQKLRFSVSLAPIISKTVKRQQKSDAILITSFFEWNPMKDIPLKLEEKLNAPFGPSYLENGKIYNNA